MHELSVCQALVRHIDRIAAQHQAREVARVQLRIGPLSGIEPDLLRQAFPLAAAASLAAAAELCIERTPLRLHCNDCGSDSDGRPNFLLCGTCGGGNTRLVSGDELLLTGIELICPEHTRDTEETLHV